MDTVYSDYKINLVSSRTVDKENFRRASGRCLSCLGSWGTEKLERQKGKRKLHLNSWKVWAPFPELRSRILAERERHRGAGLLAAEAAG